MTTTVTPGYAPLEQYGQQARFGAFTDIYALGATLYHLLTGQPPVQAPDRVSGVDLDEPRDLKPALSENVNDAILWALQINIKERPQSVPEFLDGLTDEPRHLAAGRAGAPASGRRPRGFAEPPTVPRVDVFVPSAVGSLAQRLRHRSPQVANPAPAGLATPATAGGVSAGKRSSSAGWVMLWLVAGGVGLYLTKISFSPATKVIRATPVGGWHAEPTNPHVAPLRHIQPGALKQAKIAADGSLIVGTYPENSSESFQGQANEPALKSWSANHGSGGAAFGYDGIIFDFSVAPTGDGVASVAQARGGKKSVLRAMWRTGGSNAWQGWVLDELPGTRWASTPAIAALATDSAIGKKGLLMACANSAGQIVFSQAKYGIQGNALDIKSAGIYKSINMIALSPDGRLLAVAAYENLRPIVQVWDVLLKRKLMTIPVSGDVEQIVLSSQYVLAIRTANYVALWNVRGRNRLYTHEITVASAVNFSPDGRLYAIAREGVVDVWSLAGSTQRESRTFVHGPQKGIADVAFSSDSNEIIAVALDPPTAYRWKLQQPAAH